MELKRAVAKDIFRYVRYSLVSSIGFLIVELFSYLTVKTNFNELIGVSVAYGISFFFTFIINSFVTVWSPGSQRPRIPYGKFHLYVISGIIANIGYILLQYFLYSSFNMSPLVGNLAGGVFITPLNYYYRMRKVWNVQPISLPISGGRPLTEAGKRAKIDVNWLVRHQ